MLFRKAIIVIVGAAAISALPEAGSSRRQVENGGLQRFEPVKDHMEPTDKLFRSSAPYYNGLDKNQKITPDTIATLQKNGITHIISLNEYAESKDIIKALSDAKIKYTPLPVGDFQAPTAEDLQRGWDGFVRNRPGGTLVCCGYGHGRTGTMISALQMYADHERNQMQDWTSDSYKKNHVETPQQKEVLNQLQQRLRNRPTGGKTPPVGVGAVSKSPKGTPCSKRDLTCLKSSSGGKGAKVAKFRRFRVPSSAGKAVVFIALAPYAHDLLEKIKKWDNPIGYAVKWFDDAMASLQEAIGGPQRDDIYGNELKSKLIESMKSYNRALFGENMQELVDKDRAAAKEKARQEEERKENMRIKGLEELSEACEKMSTERPEDANLATQLRESCDKLAAEIENEDKKIGEARKKIKPEFVTCGCGVVLMPGSNFDCRRLCRAKKLMSIKYGRRG